MLANDKRMRRSFRMGLAGLAVAAGIAPAASLAQDCKLSVHAAPQVIYSGQRANVNVLAHFPSPPALNAPYAFASASFDVLATDPAWTFATDGVIVGNDVLGIEVGQAHQPQMGIFAEPSNPLRVWRGIFRPQFDEPALVEIEVDPFDFSVYPSKLTSSSAECDVEGGNNYIFVNPLSAGRWVAAPGSGTTLEVRGGDGGDVLIGGLTGYDDDTIRIGMLHPAIQQVRDTESSARVEFDGEPLTFTSTVQVQHGGSGRQIEVLSWSWSGQNPPGSAPGDGSVQGLRVSGSAGPWAFEGYRGGVRVASGDLDVDGQLPPVPSLLLPSVPPQQTVSVGRAYAALTVGGVNNSATGTYTLVFDGQVTAHVRGRDGRLTAVVLDTIELHFPIREAAARNTSSDYLTWQRNLGAHVFEATGVERMTVTPSQDE